MIKTAIAFALIIALSGATIHFYLQSSNKDVELAKFQQDERELQDMRAEHEELLRLRTQPNLAQATQSVSELAKLRGQVSMLTEQTKRLTQQNQQLAQEKEQLSAQVHGVASLQNDAALMTQQKSAPIQPAQAKSDCLMHLRIIDAAKQQWALDNNKTASDIPSQGDLQPYLERSPKQIFPRCPLRGTYTIGRIQDAPTCSIPDHHL